MEIEIKLRLEKPQVFLEFLEKNATFVGREHQVDEYFTPAHRDFLAEKHIKEWLRLRNADGKISINYKNWHLDENGKGSHCDEYETLVESMEIMQKIFRSLDMTSRVVVDKTRSIWHYGEYDIGVDSVVGIGDYVEIEYLDHETTRDPDEIVTEMIVWIKSFDCGKIFRDHAGYPFILLNPGAVTSEEV